MQLKEPEVYNLLAFKAYKDLYRERPKESDEKWKLFRDTYIKLLNKKNET